MRRFLLLSLLPLGCQPSPKPADDSLVETAPDPDADDTSCEPSTWYADADADGYGDAGAPTTACVAPEGTTADATDCDDTRADAHPGAGETCNEADDDCDGAVDEDAPDASTWYADADADGYGEPGTTEVACAAPDGFVADATDCDDADADVHPGADETDCADPTDYNCDGSSSFEDLDIDGWSACEECDDGDASRNPGAWEVCDGETDEDCDELVDEDDPDLTGAPSWYRDADGDGYGNDSLVSVVCEAPTGFASRGGDCDDADSWRSPGLSEVCDDEDLDEDCDRDSDDEDVSTSAATFTTYARDADGDGYGNASRTVTQCDPPSDYVTDATDCDDGDAAISPGHVELCEDSVDNDCDTLVDDDDPSVSEGTWYADADGDGWGDPDETETACAAPTGYVSNDDDCDDADASVPDASGDCGDTGGSSSAIRFLVIGDTGDGSADQYAVASGMETVCATVGCDFVLLCGDNFYPGGVTSTTDSLWTDAFELPYGDLGLQFRAVMGNHDWDHTLDTMYLDAQVDYTAVSPNWYMPADYYTFVEGDVTFFGLDTHVVDFGAGAAQEAWLPGELASSTTTWNIAFGHHPYLSNGPHGNASGDLGTFFEDYVIGEFDVYFSGHDHNLQWLEGVDDTELIVSGAGHSTYPLWGSNATWFEAASLGFVWVEIDGSDLTAVFYDETGTELYRSSVSK